jgi:hypothetical protein
MDQLQLTTMIQDTMGLSFNEIDNHFPTIYTKDDVKAVLSKFSLSLNEMIGLQIMGEKISTNIDLEELKQNLLEALERKIDNMDSTDVVDYDSVDLMISYRNQVEIESIDVNCSTLFDEISTVINDEFDNYIEEDKAEATTEA